VIAVRRRGYHATSRRVGALADVRETWSLDLVRRTDEAGRARAWTIAGGVLLGVSVPALVAGSTLLALDGKPYRRRCSGEDVDAQGDCRFRFDSKVHGGVLVGVAAALAIGGIVMLIQARRAGPRRADARRRAHAGGFEVRW
jgi:hypothetical protein